jgi:predicted NBD/HSP70 family sugar kinase
MGINNFDIGAELKRRFPEMGLNEDVSIFLENDAAAAAIYEVVAQKGGLLNAENGSFYGLGSGLGVCLVKNGVVLPCEGGHVTLDFHEISEEYLCGCGQIGCAEVYTSVLRFRRKITQVLGLTVSDDKNIDQTLNGIETEYIIRISYNDSTPDCLLKKLTPEKIQEIQDRLTTMRKNKILRLYDNWIKAIIATLTSNVNLCATDRIVIGGSGAFLIRPDDFCHIQDAVNKRNNLYRGKKEVTILKSNAPMDAGVIGAALIPVYRKQISK